MIKRRRILIALGAGALTTPFGSFAQQQGKVWRVGFLALRGRPESLNSDVYGAFSQGLRELGYVEGRNLVIEWRFADGKYERLPGLVAELMQLNVDVIVAGSNEAASAAQKMTTTFPIVMGATSDPVGSGFVKSLARPGGNLTGLTSVSADIGPKHLEMLLSIVPKLSRVAVLVHPASPAHSTVLKNIQTAAHRSGVKVVPVNARTAREIETAFTIMKKEKAEAVIVAGTPLFNQQRRQLAELAAKYRLPSIALFRESVEAGILMSYGPSLTDLYRRVAIYVDKILKGAKPGDLPVEQPTKFELVVNLKTAKALGIKIPNSILVRADKVIE